MASKSAKNISERAALGLDFRPTAFKVWGQIEAQGNNDSYENVGEPVTLGTFDTYAEALAFIDNLSADGYGAEGNKLEARKDG